MAVKITPFCDVTRLSRHQDGNIVDYGHCLTENPSTQIFNADYQFHNLVVEPNTNTLIVKPNLELSMDNGSSKWSYSSEHPYFEVIYPSGYVHGRTLYKWVDTNSDNSFSFHSLQWYEAYQPIIVELGVMPLKGRTNTDDPLVEIRYGGILSLHISKNRSPELFQLVDSVWISLGSAELQFKYMWKDIGTDLIWFIPYYGGILISTNGTDFIFFKTFTPMPFEKYHVEFISTGGVAVFGLHNVTYDFATLRSGVVDMLNVPYSSPDVLVRGQKDSGSILGDIVMLTETSYRYRVDVYPGYRQMGIYTVSVNHPPTLTVSRASEAFVYDIEEVNESIPEDPSDETCSIVIRNSALQHSGTFKRFDNLQWYFGWTWDNSIDTPALRNVGSVIGLRDNRNVAGDCTIELDCVSPLYKVKNGTVVFTPDYSGWDIPDMLSDFLNRMGIPSDKISIDSDWVGIPLLEEADKGFIKPEYGSNAWQWIEDIVYNMLGGWVYCQRDGIIRLEPYPEVEDQVWANAFPISSYDIDSISYDEPESSLENFRNWVRVIGKDSNGLWQISNSFDAGSVYDPNSSKYTGYLIPFVYTMPFATTADWNQFVCQKLFSVLDKLRVGVTIETGSMVGAVDIYPGSLVRVDFPGGKSDYILVRSVTSRIAHSSFQQTLYGHYVSGETP